MTPHCVSVPVCVPVPRKACHTVARQVVDDEMVLILMMLFLMLMMLMLLMSINGRQVPEQVCHPKPVTKCHPVARKVPRKVSTHH